MRMCVDVLGGVKFQKAVFDTIPTSFGLGIFAEEFGNALPFVKAAIARGYTFFRVQMIWSHSNHNFGDRDIPTLNRLSRAYEAVAKANPHVTIELSFFCEHNVRNPDKYGNIVAGLAPHCTVVNSPLNGAMSKKYKNEVHGADARAPGGRFNFSFDGDDAFNSDFVKLRTKMAGAENFFLWGAGCNCHKDVNDKERKNPATPEYLKALLYLLNDKGECSLPKGALWKPMSEKWKPVLIIPQKVDEVVLKRAGKVVGRMPYFGPYVDGRHRYYFNGHGYKLKQVEVWVNKKKYGVVDAGFRVNEYR